jgi:hypothetical protein
MRTATTVFALKILWDEDESRREELPFRAGIPLCSTRKRSAHYQHSRSAVRGIPHLAKNERDVGTRHLLPIKWYRGERPSLFRFSLSSEMTLRSRALRSTALSIPSELSQRFAHDPMESLWPEMCRRRPPKHQGNVRVLKRVLDLVPPGDANLQR